MPHNHTHKSHGKRRIKARKEKRQHDIKYRRFARENGIYGKSEHEVPHDVR
jgi:hypothetical protein